MNTKWWSRRCCARKPRPTRMRPGLECLEGRQLMAVSFDTIQLGQDGDITVPADYDGDGKADVAVFRPSSGTWIIQQSSDGNRRTLQFGQSGDIPKPADYDGDGKADLAVVRNQDGNAVWYIQGSRDGFRTVQFGYGDGRDKFVPADYDGDGKADVAVFRPANSGVPGEANWSILQSGVRTVAYGYWGAATDEPKPADYDGGGRADIAVFRPANGTWFNQRSSGDLASPFYSYDGTGNNLAHPGWGSSFQDLLRKSPAGYADGVSAPAGPDRESARLISKLIVTDVSNGNTPNNRFMSDWIYAIGQFLDHDLDLTPAGTGNPAESFPIPVPAGDPFFDPTGTGTQTIPFTRSEYDPKTGVGPGNPRQQVNTITAWLDGSMVYGSDPGRADILRAHDSRNPGRLKTSPGNLPPLNTFGLPNANDTRVFPDDQLFLAGDVRANENIELTAVHTLFLREHNRQADRIHNASPQLDDDTVFQLARSIVIAEIQSITFNEFLPTLLGAGVVPAYGGYNPAVNPGVTNEFSTVAFRVGHTLLAPDVQFLNPDGSKRFPDVSLRDSFVRPDLIKERGVEPIWKYLATDNAQEVDNKIVPALQNFLFTTPGHGGFDLAALNIQRGRDNGVADYNTLRVAYGLQPVSSFAGISSNTDVQNQLRQAYGTTNGVDNVDRIDPWVGGLAEDHVGGGSVGPLFQRIIADQFQRLRDGDRLWFERQFSGDTLAALENTTLAQIIARNASEDLNLQGNVFKFEMEVNGTAFNDANGNGTRDPGEGGMAGQTVEIIDNSDPNARVVIGRTVTAADGTYHFDNLSTDLKPAVEYLVREVTSAGVTQTTADPPPVRFTRSRTFAPLDFGNSFTSPQSPLRPAAVAGVGQASAVPTQPTDGDSPSLLVVVPTEEAPWATLIPPKKKKV